MKEKFDWTEARMAKLGLLWDEGLTTSEIGHRLGTSGSSVIGKAHRMRLKPRPSPIRGIVKERAPLKRHRKVSLAPLPSLVGELNHSEKEIKPRARRQSAPPPAPLAPPPAAVNGRQCCWPIGEPGEPGFHFCGAAPQERSPYCAAHHGLAYVRYRDRREQAAEARRLDSGAAAD